MKTIRLAAIALLVLVAAALAGIGRPEAAGGADDAGPRGITVTGTGRAESVPDEATFSLGVVTDGESARTALAANSSAMRRLLAALDRAGLPRRDIKTETVSVGPDYDTGEAEGFTARNSVSVRIRTLAKVPAALGAASDAGANEISGPMLERRDRAAVEAEALENAFADARTRAGVLAKAAGVRLGQVSAVVEGVASPPEPWLGARTSLDKASSAPISPGTDETQATVTVTFEID